MVRRLSIFGLAVALLTVAVGCRSSCSSSGSGLFTSSGGAGSNCRLIGSAKPTPVYYDTTPGIPVSGPMGVAPGALVPGYGQPAPRADELPYPQPSGLIPPAGVPYAPPVPAPGDMGVNGGAPKTVQPVKGRN